MFKLETDLKVEKIANNVDLDEAAHYEPPHRDLHCLPSTI